MNPCEITVHMKKKKKKSKHEREKTRYANGYIVTKRSTDPRAFGKAREGFPKVTFFFWFLSHQ